MRIKYCAYSEKDKIELVDLITRLYLEDAGGEKMTVAKINATLEFLSNNPGAGEILMFKSREKIIGYAILIYYWSNEFGGRLTVLDELYIISDYRGKQIGTAFMNHLISKSRSTSKGIMLEVHSTNANASNFYTKLGFVVGENKHFRLML